MKKFATQLVCFLLFMSVYSINTLSAQTVQVGIGTEIPPFTLYGPVYRYSATSTTSASRSNMVITQAELSALGIITGSTITEIQFNKTNAANFNTPATSYKMYMANTSNTTLATTLTWASVLTTHTEVYTSSSFNIPLAAGWVTWSITPFVYTGGSLEIATECSMGGNGAATDAFKWEYTTGFDDKLVGVASLGATLNGAVTGYKQRPNCRITYVAPFPCSAPPTAGNVTSSLTSVCANQPFSLNLTGNSAGTGQTYQWQYSTTGNAPWSNFGTSSIDAGYSNATQTASQYYRCAVTCSGQTSYSDSLQIISPGLLSGTYTINNALPTGGGNFQSLTLALDYIKCGINGPVTFNVEPGSGPYNEQLTINPIFGASANNTITINGNGASLVYSTGVTNARTGIILNGADHIVIDSLVVDVSAGTFGWGIGLTSGADSNVIRKCTVITDKTTTSSNYAGIVINGSLTTTATTGNNGNGNIIENNIIQGGYYGLYLYGNSTANAQNYQNTIRNNSIEDFYYSGIYGIYQDSLIAKGNNISRPTRTNSVGSGAGIYLTTGNINLLVDGNKIFNLFASNTAATTTFYGIYLSADGTQAKPNKIINNAIFNIEGNGTFSGIYNTGAEYMKAYHNTISLDYAAATAGITYGFYQVTSAVGIEFKNNIVTISRGGTGAKYCIYKSTATTPLESNNNVLFMNSPTSTTQAIGYQTSARTSLSDWQTASGHDLNSVSIDPLYADINILNFTPTEVTVDNIGANVGVATDINGVARTLSSPDPGAYEVPPSVGTDLRIEELVSPSPTVKGCYNTENLIVAIKNVSIDSINFALKPATVTVTVAGSVNVVYTTTINTGILHTNESLNVTFTSPSATVNMSAAGGYSFNIVVDVNGDVNTANNALDVTLDKLSLTGGTSEATPENYCAVGGTPKLISTDAEGYSNVKWQMSINGGTNYTDILNSDTLIYTLTTPISQATYFRMVAVCGVNEEYSTADSVLINNPAITSTTPATRCGPGSVTLGATANGTATVKWYETPTSTTVLATGPSFVIPTVLATKTFYAAASEGGGGTVNQLDALPLAGGNGCGGGNMINLTPTTNIDLQGFILNVGNAAGISTPVSVWYKTGTYVGSENTQANWTLHQTLNVTAAGPNLPTTLNMNPLLLTGGQIYGIYIQFEADYTNITANTFFSNADLTMEIGIGVCTPFTSFNALRGFNGSVLYTKGCEGTRTPVTATITSAPAITVTTNDSVICNAGTAAISVASTNSNYTYAWSPSAQTTQSINVTPTETTKYYVNATDAGLNCTAIDSVTINVQPVVTSIEATEKEFCVVGGITTLSLNPLTGYSTTGLQWQSSTNNIGFTDIPGATSSTYTTPTITATTYFKALIKNGAGTVCSDSVKVIKLNNPTVISTTDSSRCGTGTVTLSATSATDNVLKWYENATGGVALATGDTFVTPSISNTTTYYVASSSGGTNAYTGLTDKLSTATSGAGTTNFGLVFDALSEFKLKSVVVHAVGAAGSTGTVTIDVIDASNTVLHTATVNVNGNPIASTVGERVVLNFLIQPGTNLKLRHSARSASITGLAFEPSASAPSGNYGYPYVVPGLLSINTSTLSAGPTNTPRNDLYYYFYDWEVETGCESARVAVTATVDNTPGCGALPVSLTSFTGIKEGNKHKLNWITTTEVNNAGFSLERSADGVNFSSLTYIPSKATNGNSNNNLLYSYLDEKVMLSNNYYRLKQIDKDGNYAYSPIVLLKGDKVKNITITSLYPNPAKNEIKVSIESPTAEKVTLLLTDLTGKTIQQKTTTLKSGSNLIDLNVTTLAQGTYFVKIICSNGCETGVTKFIKQ